jgi:hypothetical protein
VKVKSRLPINRAPSVSFVSVSLTVISSNRARESNIAVARNAEV